jgi:hypothetical protein
VYRALVKPLPELLGGAPLFAPGSDGTLKTAVPGALPAATLGPLCGTPFGALMEGCVTLEPLRTRTAVTVQAEPVDVAAFPLGYGVVAVTTLTTFVEPAPTSLQSLYFVRAVDAEGNLSPPSNFVGGPSKAAWDAAAARR